MFSKLNDMERFLAIVEAGSLHEAAARLDVSQPALSRVLKKIEEDCGGALFDRLPRGVSLTPLGQLVSERCRHIIRECEVAQDDIKALAAGRSGTLRLSAGPVWIFAILPQVLPALSQTFPNVRIQLSSRGFHDAVLQLEQGLIDAHVGGFDSEAPLPLHLTRVPLMDVRLGVVAVADHPIFQGEVCPADLCDYPWIDYGTGRRAGTHVWPGVEDIQAEVKAKTGRRFKTVVECDASGLALMRTAPYLAYLPVTIAENIPGLPLREVPVSLEPKVFRAGVVLRRSLQNSPVVSDLISRHRIVL